MTTFIELLRSTPEAQGVSSSALHAFIDAIEQNNLELHSLMLLRHGTVVAEGWWAPYRAEYPHLLNSLSKSFTSTAIGLAVAEGRLTIDDPVLSFFPESAPIVVSDNLAAMRVRHLLSMSTGHAEDTTATRSTDPDPDWVRHFLSLPIVYIPGTHFLYNSGATYMLSAIVQKVTGLLLLDYLRPRLLDPLGITDITSEISPQGIQTGGWGMSITTDAIARFGQLYLQRGQWNGQQLVPAEWVAQATSFQVSNADNALNSNLDWQQGYGFQFWRCRYNCYRGDGAFGQYCLVMPDHDAVLAITASVIDMQAVLNLVWEHIRPGIQSEHSLPANPTAAVALSQKLISLHLELPSGESTNTLAAHISGQKYTLSPNPLSISSLQFDFSAAGCMITFQTANGDQRVLCGAGSWQSGALSLFRHSARLVASGVWTSADTFTITLRFYETSAIYTLACQFDENRLNTAIHVEYVLNGQDYKLDGVRI